MAFLENWTKMATLCSGHNHGGDSTLQCVWLWLSLGCCWD